MAKDHFPATLHTWIGQNLQQGGRGRAVVNRHIMETYFEPLRIYFLGTNSTWLGEPEDVIHGFFASRLERDSFFTDWSTSGKPLRRWLMNAFCFYLMELRKLRRRDEAGGGDEAEKDAVTFSGDPEAVFERATASSFVRQALQIAAAECDGGGLADHWQMFLRHHVDGLSYGRLADQFDVAPARAAVMSRTASRKFQNAMRLVLERDGITDAAFDDEISRILENLS